MLRPATPEALQRLAGAADNVDRELDTALTCLGILPPLDLVPIRKVLGLAGASLRGSANGDGHRVIEIDVDGVTVASIHHDGRVVEHTRRDDFAVA